MNAEVSNKPLEMHDYLPSQKCRDDIRKYLTRKGLDSESNIILKSLPSSLYSYQNLHSFTVDGLLNNEITLTNPLIFNDIYDSTLHRNSEPHARKEQSETITLMQQLKDLNKSRGLYQFDIESIQATYDSFDYERSDRNFLKYMTSDYRIKCFSEVCESILMWSHYANNHKGICIEYNFLQDTRKKDFLYPVTYLKEPIDISLLANDSIPIDEIDNNNQLSMAVVLGITTKYKVWEYEKEWRLIIPFPFSKSEDRVPVINNPLPKSIILGAGFIDYWRDVQSGKEKVILNKFLQYVSDNVISLKVIKPKVLSYELEVIDISYEALYKKLKS